MGRLAGLFCFLLFLFDTDVAHAKREVLRIRLPFQILKDNPDVRNSYDGLGTAGAFPFGLIGNLRGVCEGLSSMTAAFRRHAVFQPDLPMDPSGVLQDKMDATLAAYRTGCPLQVEFQGLDSLWALSRREPSFTRMRVVDMNLANIKEQALQFLGELFFLRDRARIRDVVMQTVSSIRADLEAGRYPLLLYRSHVVMVFGMDVRPTIDPRRISTVFTYYDPNFTDEVQFMDLETDAHTGMLTLLPVVGPIWNVSPDRPPYRGDCNQLREQYAHVLPVAAQPRSPSRWQPFRAGAPLRAR